jgi:hypothetical protein
LRCGSTTCSANPVAAAASKALPPRSSTDCPTAVASQWVLATMPKVPASSGRVEARLLVLTWVIVPGRAVTERAGRAPGSVRRPVGSTSCRTVPSDSGTS